MKTKRLLYIAIILLSAHHHLEAQTLSESVKIMLEREPELLAANADSRSAYENWKVTKGALLPQVSANGSPDYRVEIGVQMG